MTTLREFTFPSSDGVHQVHAAEWTPEKAPRAVVQLVHGISEYSGRYDAFARFLNYHGFAVCGHDHLGHGRTVSGPGEFGFLGQRDGWDHLTLDVRALRELEGARFPGIPYFILGHSMGSFVTRTYLIRWSGTVDGAILSGTGQEPPLLVGFAKLACSVLCALRGPNSRSRFITSLSLGAYNRQFRPNRTPNDWISRDQAIVDAYNADPLCQFVPTVGMFRDMMQGLRFISDRANLSRMDPNTPVYLFSGDRDPVGSCGRGVEKVAGFFREAGTTDLTVKLYPGGRHEMLNEVEREQVFADVLSWLEGHMPR